MSESDEQVSVEKAQEQESFLAEMNARFTEMRTLMITIGSILALLMPVVHNLGFVDLGVDWLTDKVEDDPDLNPYYNCEEDWELIVDDYVVGYDVLLNIQLRDWSICNQVHTIEYQISMSECCYDTYYGESDPFRNNYIFTHTIHDLQEGSHHLAVEVFNGSISLFEVVVIDFEFDENEQENAVYGCTDPVALNYNETATHEDGSCEYEQEEEEVTDDCVAVFYEAIPRWGNNTSSLYNDFDVDFTCMANVTVTVTIDVYAEDNTTLLYNGSTEFATYHYDWDYHYLDFRNITKEDNMVVHYRVYHEGDLDDELWYELET